MDSGTFGYDWLPGWRISRGFGHLWPGLVTRLGHFLWTRAPFGGIGYPVDGFQADSGTIRQDWLPGWGISYGLGHHSAGLVTLLGDFLWIRAPWARLVTLLVDILWIRAPFGGIGYPDGISRGFGHHSSGSVTLLMDICRPLLPFCMIGYPVATFRGDSGTFGHDWLPCWRISRELGHHST